MRIEGKVINDLNIHTQGIAEIEIQHLKKMVRGMEEGPSARYDSDFKRYHRFLIDEGPERKRCHISKIRLNEGEEEADG
jgi:hypothetical protein